MRMSKLEALLSQIVSQCDLEIYSDNRAAPKQTAPPARRKDADFSAHRSGSYVRLLQAHTCDGNVAGREKRWSRSTGPTKFPNGTRNRLSACVPTTPR